MMHAHKAYLISILYPLHVANNFTYSMWWAFLLQSITSINHFIINYVSTHSTWQASCTLLFNLHPLPTPCGEDFSLAKHHFIINYVISLKNTIFRARHSLALSVYLVYYSISDEPFWMELGIDGINDLYTSLTVTSDKILKSLIVTVKIQVKSEF